MFWMLHDATGAEWVCMSMLIHARSHPDDLVGLLADQLAQPLADPFATEVVAVPTRGIERWLTQRIASELGARDVGDGVCANVAFPSPGRLVFDILRRVPELEASVAAWEGGALVGRVLEALDEHRTEDWLWLLDRYLGEPDRSGGNGRRISAARKVARLFTRYARRRPQMILAWVAGEDLGPDGEPISDVAVWQPRLWRLLRGAIDVPSLPELLPAGLDPIRSGAIDPGLPPRLAVYGLTALDPLDLQVLEAMSAQRDLHLYLLHPSPALWRLMTNGDAAAANERRTNVETDAAAHPLLASWARDSRELQLVLRSTGLPTVDITQGESGVSATLLGRLQDDVRHNLAPAYSAELASTVSSGTDRSVQIHVCHGERRQVEVARDAVLHALSADPSLEPRDVVIMTPDLATFGPLLEAAFPVAGRRVGDAGAATDALPDLRVRIADRAPAATNPLVRLAATVLDLAASRLETSAIRELIAEPAVRRRFNIDEDTAGQLHMMIDDANVKWGLDAGHREQWGAGRLADQTWRRALDRALAGVYLSDNPTRVVGDIAPLDGIEGQEAIVAGLLAQILDRVVAVKTQLEAARPRGEWAEAIASSVQLLAAPGWDDEWQWSQLGRLLQQTFEPDGDAPEPAPLLSRAEAAVLVADWAQDQPSPLHFRTGDITVCTLAPMRSVPYRVVCLVGMDDDRFPRISSSDGDDLLADHEVVGDPDRAAEDRQLLLDAVMAAGDHLVMTYSGRDELTNAKYPPAVPIAELRDVLQATVGSAALEHLITQHPLQGFSLDNFIDGRLGVAGPWSFDPMQFDGARALQQGPEGVAQPDIRPAALDMPDPVLLPDLVAFLRNPARWYLRKHMQFSIPAAPEPVDDTLVVDVNNLEAWALRERILTGLAFGGDVAAVAAHIRASDALPPGDLGNDDLASAVEQAAELWDLAVDQDFAPDRHRQFAGEVSIGGVTVEGKVEADPEAGQLVTLTASRLGARLRIVAACELAFLSAFAPDIPWRAVLIGRADRGPTLRVVTLGPMGGDPAARHTAASDQLGGLLSLYIQGHSGPVPLPAKTSYAWQRGLGTGRSEAYKAARQAWVSDRFSPESSDPAYGMVFPEMRTLDALLASDFPVHAGKLWLPILAISSEKTK